ncbi:hypothetical protein Droror1_Dr00022325 [Drosera rotundifolia]
MPIRGSKCLRESFISYEKQKQVTFAHVKHVVNNNNVCFTSRSRKRVDVLPFPNPRLFPCSNPRMSLPEVKLPTIPTKHLRISYTSSKRPNSYQPTTISTANTATTMTTTSPTHVLVFPYPAQGHMIPLLDLTHHLAQKGLTITVLVTPKNLSILAPLLASNPSIQTLVLPFPGHPSLPPGVEHLKDIGNRGNLGIMAALSKLHQPIKEWIKEHTSPPKAILSDFFLGWTTELATEVSIPRIVFFSSGCFFACINSHLWLNRATLVGLPVVEFPDLPRSPSLIEAHLPSQFIKVKASDPQSENIRKGILGNLASWGCVFNSFHALEGDYLDHMKNKYFVQGRVYGLGPLNLMGGPMHSRPSETVSDARHEVLDWLDDRPDGSVLYVSFGTQKFLTRAQTEALGLALERSLTRFIWVLRAPKGEEERLEHETLDLEERVKGRGFVIKHWAPQVEILGHRAVGGFLSHCGWNSVLESLAAGVMILAWPMEADQYINAKLLVEDAGVAVKVCEGPETVPEPDELARVISAAFTGETPQKKKTAEMREKVYNAVDVDRRGSSIIVLDELVKELTQLAHLEL